MRRVLAVESIREILSEPRPWAYGRARISRQKGIFGNSRRQSWGYQPRISFNLHGVSPKDQIQRVTFDFQNNQLQGRDNNGNRVWLIQLPSSDRSHRYGYYGYGRYRPTPAHGRIEGNLMVALVNKHIVGIDLLSALNNKPSNSRRDQGLLWRLSVHNNSPLDESLEENDPFGTHWHDPSSEDYSPNKLVLGPITEGGIAVVRSRSLVSLDPISGEPLWIRRNVSPEAEIYGDREVLVVVEPEENKALLLRSLDGEEITEKKNKYSRQESASWICGAPSIGLESGESRNTSPPPSAVGSCRSS